MAEAEILNAYSSSAADSIKDLRPILQALLRTNENLAAQNKALYQLFASGDTTSSRCDSVLQGGHTTNNYPAWGGSTFSSNSLANHQGNGQTNTQIWEGILSTSATESDQFMQAFYYWSRPTQIEEVLNQRRKWASWSYAAAFPELSKFLKRIDASRRCDCQVWMDDFIGLNEKPRSIPYSRAKRINQLWDVIKDRDPLPSFDTNPKAKDMVGVSIRLFKIVDLSPLVLAAILGSTSQSDLSYLAAFVERHLKFSNWGKVSLLKFGDLSWSSYTLEYHFSFYYVTPEYSETDSIKLDPRKCRKSAPFGRELATETRYIHEETLSFLFIGHFKDVASCVQLAESYFKFDPYKKNTQPSCFRSYSLNEPPALLLLAWISVGLHHVLWRWQSAIEALENEIKSSAQIVFLEDRSDLMADDPQFSLSKTYFWALQAYKMFEQTLLETIMAWEKFKQDSLPRLQDPRVTSEDWKIHIQEINDAVKQLEFKVARVQKSIAEVEGLRQGLISASALFDSRTAVRQGENIRLLTYITILFLPLSFATSIFGMQILSNSPAVIAAFVISVPTITFGTALFIFNLELLLDMWTAMTDYCADWLRLRMRHHRRNDWKDRAIALHEDSTVARAPVRKAQRQSSGWVYLLFLLEYVLVALPVGEIGAGMEAVGLLGNADRASSGVSTHQRRASVVIEHGIDGMHSGNTKREQTKARIKEIKERIGRSLEDEKRLKKARKYDDQGPFVATFSKVRKSISKAVRRVLKVSLGFLRSLLIPVWILVLSIEYITLVTILAFRSRPTNPLSPAPQPKSIHIQAWNILGLSALLPLTRTPTDHSPSNPDFEARTVTRVATRLGSMASPRVTDTSPSINPLSRFHNTSSTNLIYTSPDSKRPQLMNVNRTDMKLSSLAQHEEDILRVPSSTTTSSSKGIGADGHGRKRSPTRGGLEVKVSLEDIAMEEVFGGRGGGTRMELGGDR